METISGYKDAHRAICRCSTEDNKSSCKSMESKAKKVVSEAMREKHYSIIQHNMPY